MGRLRLGDWALIGAGRAGVNWALSHKALLG
jgi:hypothetical protein